MAKVQIKSEKLTPFGGFFSIMEQFDSMLSPIIDQTLGQRCSSIIGYQFSEIVRSLMSVYFCGGSCVEDVTSQLMILYSSKAHSPGRMRKISLRSCTIRRMDANGVLVFHVQSSILNTS